MILPKEFLLKLRILICICRKVNQNIKMIILQTILRFVDYEIADPMIRKVNKYQ